MSFRLGDGARATKRLFCSMTCAELIGPVTTCLEVLLQGGCFLSSALFTFSARIPKKGEQWGWGGRGVQSAVHTVGVALPTCRSRAAVRGGWNNICRSVACHPRFPIRERLAVKKKKCKKKSQTTSAHRSRYQNGTATARVLSSIIFISSEAGPPQPPVCGTSWRHPTSYL